MNVTHEHPAYRARLKRTHGRNGAYWYSREIVENIIPMVETDRPWVTVNQPPFCEDRAIVFVHNNLRPERYEWLSAYKDLVLVCGVPQTVPKVDHLGRSVYLPLSIDVGYVERFRRDKDRDRCFVGRKSKRDGIRLPSGTDYLENMDRDDLLAELARYRRAYAVGRCAIEAMALGCEVMPYDERYPDPSIWRVLDNRDAAIMLQKILDGC